MTYFIWTFRLVFLSLVLGFLHYTLPQHDIVRITGTDIIRPVSYTHLTLPTKA